MPWHVAKSSKCGDDKPWAVIKDSDSSVVACHPTKAKANQQLAALYANEPSARSTAMADVKAGDHVKWKASGSHQFGIVKSVHTSSTVPNVDHSVQGSEKDPAARVQHLLKTQDGKHIPIAKHSAHKVASLTKVGPLPIKTGGKKAFSFPPGANNTGGTTTLSAPRPERRTIHVEPRAITTASDGKKQFWARVCNYNVVDDYGTKWIPGVFTDYLQQRMPRLLFGHGGWGDLSNVLGRGIDHKDGADGLDVLFELDDFDAVPSARQVWAQLQSGTLDEFSVGFVRKADKIEDSGDGEDFVVDILKADLPECSVVLQGAVPGTRLLSMTRSAKVNGNVPAQSAAEIMTRHSLGEIDLGEALTEFRALVMVPNDATTIQGADPADVATAARQVDAAIDAIRAEVNGDNNPAQVTDLLGVAEEMADQLLDLLGEADPDEAAEEDDAAATAARAAEEAETQRVAAEARQAVEAAEARDALALIEY